MKSRLIRLMTNLDTDLKHCAADLIFVLCKENGKRKQGEDYQLSTSKSQITKSHSSFINHLSLKRIEKYFVHVC